MQRHEIKPQKINFRAVKHAKLSCFDSISKPLCLTSISFNMKHNFEIYLVFCNLYVRAVHVFTSISCGYIQKYSYSVNGNYIMQHLIEYILRACVLLMTQSDCFCMSIQYHLIRANQSINSMKINHSSEVLKALLSCVYYQSIKCRGSQFRW